MIISGSGLAPPNLQVFSDGINHYLHSADPRLLVLQLLLNRGAYPLRSDRRSIGAINTAGISADDPGCYMICFRRNNSDRCTA